MKKHVHMLGVLYLVFGAMGLVAILVSIGLVLLAGGLAAARDPQAGVLISMLIMVLLVIFAVASLPNLLAGWGLIRHSPWSRPLTIVLSVVNLFAFPLGTALGVYGLWVLFQAGAVDLLREGAPMPQTGA